MAEILAVAEVRIWDHRVGAVAEETDGTVTFEFDPAFTRLGLEISPLLLPLSLQGPVTFPALRRTEAFEGLPGVLADALPDRFGNAVIRKFFTDRGIPDAALSPVQKLLYVGARAMGALEFRPALRLPATAAEREALEVADLVAQARQVVEGRTDVAIPEMIRVGASAGGARPKALILWNPAAREVRSGFARPRAGDEPWIIKFDGVGELGAADFEPRPYNRIEYAYSLMAREAGLDVSETQLLEEGGRAHFMVRRFDRQGARRMHFHSLGGLHHADYNVPHAFSYEQYLRTVLDLNLGYPALEEAFRRAVFNIAAVNQDDHVKNLAFLMDGSGAWRMAPAFDLTYAKGAGFTRTHQMTLAGNAEGITRADLLALGARFGIKKDGAEVIASVIEALGGWEGHAEAAGVSADRVRLIASELGAI